MLFIFCSVVVVVVSVVVVVAAVIVVVDDNVVAVICCCGTIMRKCTFLSIDVVYFLTDNTFTYWNHFEASKYFR